MSHGPTPLDSGPHDAKCIRKGERSRKAERLIRSGQRLALSANHAGLVIALIFGPRLPKWGAVPICGSAIKFRRPRRVSPAPPPELVRPERGDESDLSSIS